LRSAAPHDLPTRSAPPGVVECVVRSASRPHDLTTSRLLSGPAGAPFGRACAAPQDRKTRRSGGTARSARCARAEAGAPVEDCWALGRAANLKPQTSNLSAAPGESAAVLPVRAPPGPGAHSTNSSIAYTDVQSNRRVNAASQVRRGAGSQASQSPHSQRCRGVATPAATGKGSPGGAGGTGAPLAAPSGRR